MILPLESVFLFYCDWWAEKLWVWGGENPYHVKVTSLVHIEKHVFIYYIYKWTTKSLCISCGWTKK